MAKESMTYGQILEACEYAPGKVIATTCQGVPRQFVYVASSAEVVEGEVLAVEKFFRKDVRKGVFVPCKTKDVPPCGYEILEEGGQ